MITMTRVAPPTWATPQTQTAGEHGIQARTVFTPLLPEIYAELDERINAFANDPDQGLGDDFPDRARLDGRYYIASETYEGDSDDDAFHLWLEIRFVARDQEADYLRLEAFVTVDPAGDGFEFDEGCDVSRV